jgi:hypothetical protein
MYENIFVYGAPEERARQQLPEGHKVFTRNPKTNPERRDKNIFIHDLLSRRATIASMGRCLGSGWQSLDWRLYLLLWVRCGGARD